MKINSISSNNFERKFNAQPVQSFAAQAQRPSGNNISFKGGLPQRVYNKATDGIAVVLGKVASTKFAKNVVDFINGDSKSKILRGLGKALNFKNKWFQHAIAAESIYLTSFYMYNTKKSKTIPEDQKRPMMVNQALVATLCTSLSYMVDSKISKAFKGMHDFFLITNAASIAEGSKSQVAAAIKAEGNNKDAIELAAKMPLKKVNAICSGISKLKSVLVFGFIFRYFSPVFITPIANRVSEYLDKKNGKNQKAALK